MSLYRFLWHKKCSGGDSYSLVFASLERIRIFGRVADVEICRVEGISMTTYPVGIFDHATRA